MLNFDPSGVNTAVFLEILEIVSYLLSDFLLHFDWGSQFSHLLDSVAGVATIFPKHVVL